MKLVAVTRILNEDDVVEAFVRHHHTMVDHLVFLDNGSHDRSIDILRALKDEGLPITLLKIRSAWSEEMNHLTVLHRYAARSLGADWILHLDTDEFLDGRSAGQSIRERLAGLPGEARAMAVRIVEYPSLPTDDHDELVVPKRLTSRQTEPQDTSRLTVRGGPAAERTIIGAGGHEAWLDLALIKPVEESAFRIAHYPRRSPWQQVSKAAIGRLKALAAGKAIVDAGHGAHYTNLLQFLKERPQDLFNNPKFMDGSGADMELVYDPIAYAGGELRYTETDDPRLKAVRCLAGYAEELALQHGRLVDENTAVRALLNTWISQVQLVF